MSMVILFPLTSEYFERYPVISFIIPKTKHMLWTIAIILLVLWLIGNLTAYTLGGFIHVLLVIAVILVIVRLLQGRSVL